MPTNDLTLIADSGSTKTDWALMHGKTVICQFRTEGFNPFFFNTSELTVKLQKAVSPQLGSQQDNIRVIRFYGAGCRDHGTIRMEAALRQIMPQAEAHVYSDMIGAAKALLGQKEGIACILGTGANSCVFDGKAITTATPALGYILGDEGSGTAMGRHLLADVLKGRLPSELRLAFASDYPTATLQTITENIYHHSFPNRYMAGFVPFLKAHIDHPAIHALVTGEFISFFRRNVNAYKRTDLDVGFVGSVAYAFRPQLMAAAATTGHRLGEILRSPFERLERL